MNPTSPAKPPARWRAYTHGIPMTCAIDHRFEVGEEFDIPWLTGNLGRGRVLKHITRDEHIYHTEALNRMALEREGRVGHTGTYNPQTKEYKPGYGALDGEAGKKMYYYWIEIREDTLRHER